jgi:hypothetical protein
MSCPVAKFKNNNLAAHSVLEHLTRHRSVPEQFWGRPFNQYSPDFSRWWLVPDASWPAYKRGKLSFRQCPWNNRAMYVGYYAEKGFDKSIAKVSGVNPNLVLQPDWHWRKFIQNAFDGELDSAAKEVIRRSACPILLLVEVYGVNSIPKPGAQEKADESARFEMNSADGGYETVAPGHDTLRSLNGCTTAKDIAAHLEKQDLRFFWVDLHIGITIPYVSGNEVGTWGASDIWHNALAPWTRWVVV